ncbi:hypothetical protein SBOR_1125 [Sclerotinia borealis F-4128]|uniref:Uncharacterized protein n=1 Tax=Sclerotinia borealis (strain F-4128) TaxID=1432307 RepID=W9CQW7_SCLBF|nr:hypothetical protein SBOR_1125 [Sclerotinia borealis F-4128]
MATIQIREATQQLIKRKNWAASEPGVIVVFVVVFIVASGLIGLQLSRWIARRREKQAARLKGIVISGGVQRRPQDLNVERTRILKEPWS